LVVKPNLTLIGASDAPAILSLEEYRGPADVYMKVRHGIAPVEAYDREVPEDLG